MLARNVFPPGARRGAGEIDIIVAGEGTIVFVEVRRRGPRDVVGALGSVTPAKRRALCEAARRLVTVPPYDAAIAAAGMRFDVIALTGADDPAPVHVRDAFRCDG